jgi:hypothetical protein
MILKREIKIVNKGKDESNKYQQPLFYASDANQFAELYYISPSRSRFHIHTFC